MVPVETAFTTTLFGIDRLEPRPLNPAAVALADVGLVVAPMAAPLTLAAITWLLVNPVPVMLAAAKSVAVVAVAKSFMRYQTDGLSAATITPYGSIGDPDDALTVILAP